jgi:hypothetical protein
MIRRTHCRRALLGLVVPCLLLSAAAPAAAQHPLPPQRIALVWSPAGGTLYYAYAPAHR